MATPKAALNRPGSDEYAPYYEKYVSLVPEGDVITTLKRQLDSTLALIRGLNESQGANRYAPDKWSIKELLGHIIDTERIFGYRALRFARNDKTPLPGYEQDDYVRNANFDGRQLSDLANEFEGVRRSNIELFKSFTEDAWSRCGTANDYEVTVLALAHIIAGHEAHHVGILRTRYFSGD